MRLLIFLFLFSASQMLFSQDTVVVYFDKNWGEISNKDIAVYYRRAFVDSNDTWTAHDYYMSNQIQMSCKYKSKKLKVRQGNCIYYYENGEIESKGLYSNDKRDGIWSYWYENGIIKSEGLYINDKHERVWKYYHENGAKKAEGKFKDNLSEGVWEYWYDSGEKKAEGKYWNDKKDGAWNYLYVTGELESVEIHSKGEIISAIGYYENGKNKFKGSYVNGLRQDEWIYWNVDGRVTFKGAFNNGYKNGEWIRYFPEAEMKIRYENGVLQGKGLGGIVITE